MKFYFDKIVWWLWFTLFDTILFGIIGRIIPGWTDRKLFYDFYVSQSSVGYGLWLKIEARKLGIIMLQKGDISDR